VEEHAARLHVCCVLWYPRARATGNKKNCGKEIMMNCGYLRIKCLKQYIYASKCWSLPHEAIPSAKERNSTRNTVQPLLALCTPRHLCLCEISRQLQLKNDRQSWPIETINTNQSPMGIPSTSSDNARQLSACNSAYFTRSWLQS
jgi:hypothetical protein